MAMYRKEHICQCCGRVFIAKAPVAKFCSQECRDCIKGIRKTAEKVKAHTKSKFAPVNEFIKKHYEETGVYLTYGKAVVLMERSGAE
jgi:hypothetical protein